MSKAQMDVTVSLPKAAALGLCRAAALQLRWRVQRENAQGLGCEVAREHALSVKGSFDVDIAVNELGPARTRIAAELFNWGIGPVQSRHLAQQAGALRDLILQLESQNPAQQSPAAAASPTPAARAEAAPPAPAPAEGTDLGSKLWGWAKAAGRRMVEAGAAQLAHRAMIQSVVSAPFGYSQVRLQEYVGKLDDAGMRSFRTTLTVLRLEAQRVVWQQPAGSISSWGSTSEDRVAMALNHVTSSGTSFTPAASNGYVNNLNIIATQAEQAYGAAQKQRRAQAAAAAAAPRVHVEPAKEKHVDMQAIEQALEEFTKTGRIDPAILRQIQELTDSDAIEAVTAKLRAAGGDTATSNPLQDIAAYYVEGDAQYTPRWPIQTALLTMPFDQLDRRTQFYVLFQEWTRRELDAMNALSTGDAAQAQQVFNECLERAFQLDVAELVARSYEGLVRVAQRRDDPEAAHRWLEAAIEVRKRMP